MTGITGPYIERQVQHGFTVREANPKMGLPPAPADLSFLALAPRLISSAEYRDWHERNEILQRKTRLEAYAHDANSLRSLLSTNNVRPIAVLPRVAWNTLCKEANLYRLSPDDAGCVEVEPADSTYCNKVFWWTVVVALIAASLAGVLCSQFTSIEKTFGYATLVMCAFVGFGYHLILRITLQLRSWTWVLNQLFPQGEESTSPYRVRMKVKFPSPPESVVGTILTLTLNQELSRKLKLEAGVTANEITISEGFGDVPWHSAAKNKEFDRRSMVMCVSLGAASAIVVQYGDELPFSANMLERVVNSVHFI